MNQCIVCKATEVGIHRLNEKGVLGIGACTDCRPLFERGLQSTDDVLERAHLIAENPRRASHFRFKV